ncbi:MAG: TetR family transcriptional regulator [Solirubrobacteraceae bacterium]
MPSQLRANVLDHPGREGGHVAEMQRRRLLLAFAEVLAESGLEDTGVGRVCKRAGVSRRTFYDLFEDREACFVAVVDVTTERISQSALPVYTGNGRWRERVRAALSVLLGFLQEEPVLARVCLIETLKAGPAVAERRRRVLDALAAAVDGGRSESKTGAEPPPLTGQSTVGGAVSVIHAHVLEGHPGPLMDLLNPLMSMIVHPYLGPAAARRELSRDVPQASPVHNDHIPKRARDPFKDLPIRITFRTARVLAVIAVQPGASNRQIGDIAGVSDQGQISKLLSRLAGYGLIENQGEGHIKGEPNAWTLTELGQAIQETIAGATPHMASSAH